MRINKTLLILLGILLACLITLNAKSLYSADLLNPTKSSQIEKATPRTLIDKLGTVSLASFTKKITSLNK